jgi:Ca2+-binding EF-hand superfamily protein
LLIAVAFSCLCSSLAQYEQQGNPQQMMGQPQQQQYMSQQPQHFAPNHPPPPQYQQQQPNQQGYGQPVPNQMNQPNLLHDKSRIQDREHIKEHLHGVLGEPDVGKMTEEELQFHYFKMHDNDNNNKLDGCELIKSLIHWHVEESKHLGTNAPPTGTTKIFTDIELTQMIDPILEMDDRNRDGYIDYAEFVAAQKSRGF